MSRSLQEGPAPDVWLQLLERYAEDQPGCQPAALRSLAQQLAQQRALIALQQQQLTVQQDIAAKQHTLDEQQQQLNVMQERLSSQLQVTAEQDTRMAGLEGQLQEMQAQLQKLLQRQPPDVTL